MTDRDPFIQSINQLNKWNTDQSKLFNGLKILDCKHSAKKWREEIYRGTWSSVEMYDAFDVRPGAVNGRMEQITGKINAQCGASSVHHLSTQVHFDQWGCRDLAVEHTEGIDQEMVVLLIDSHLQYKKIKYQFNVPRLIWCRALEQSIDWLIDWLITIKIYRAFDRANDRLIGLFWRMPSFQLIDCSISMTTIKHKSPRKTPLERSNTDMFWHSYRMSDLSAIVESNERSNLSRDGHLPSISV